MEIKTDITKFSKNMESFIPLLTLHKQNIVKFLEKYFKENIHFIKIINNIKKGRGGHNKVDYMLTEETYELVKNTYNLKHRYITKACNIEHVNIAMSLENQTIGFIENSFKDVIEVKRQYKFDKYFVDLYFPLYKLVVECDENNHLDRDVNYEKEREEYIKSFGNIFIRFNPNEPEFDISFVLNKINKVIISKI